MHACKVYSTQALTENCRVCLSQRIEVGAGVGVGPEVADAPDVLAAVDPTLLLGLCSVKHHPASETKEVEDIYIQNLSFSIVNFHNKNKILST